MQAQCESALYARSGGPAVPTGRLGRAATRGRAIRVRLFPENGLQGAIYKRIQLPHGPESASLKKSSWRTSSIPAVVKPSLNCSDPSSRSDASGSSHASCPPSRSPCHAPSPLRFNDRLPAHKAGATTTEIREALRRDIGDSTANKNAI